MATWLKVAGGALSTLLIAGVLGAMSALSTHSVDIATLQTQYSYLKEGQIRIERKQDKILDKLEKIGER